jgi:hypothetical protein
MSVRRTREDPLSLFLAERYVPEGRSESVIADVARASAASDELAAEGTRARHLHSMLIPSDEICFALFEANSAEEVRRLIERASIPYERVVEAVQIGREEAVSVPPQGRRP